MPGCKFCGAPLCVGECLQTSLKAMREFSGAIAQRCDEQNELILELQEQLAAARGQWRAYVAMIGSEWGEVSSVVAVRPTLTALVSALEELEESVSPGQCVVMCWTDAGSEVVKREDYSGDVHFTTFRPVDGVNDPAWRRASIPPTDGVRVIRLDRVALAWRHDVEV